MPRDSESRPALGQIVLRRLSGAAPHLVVVGAFAHALLIGWGKWGDLFVDTGRELDLPRRLMNGERLYVDLRWYYGPLAPYVNAALYRVFGVSSDVLVGAGIASAAALTLLLFSLGRRFVGPWVSAAVAVAFVYVCAFKHLGNLAVFNFALPYTYAATYGMLASAGSLLLLVRYVERERAVDLVGSVALLVLAALCKLEVLFPALAIHGAFLTAWAAPGRLRVRPHVVCYAGGLLIVAAVYGALAWAAGPDLWRENLGALANGGSRHFIAWTSGLGDVGTSLRAVLASAGLMAAALGLAWAMNRAGRSRPRRRVALAAVAFAAVFAAYARFGLRAGFQALPVLLLAGAVGAAWSWARDGREVGRLTSSLILLFGLVALLRIVLRVQPDHYGFYLLPVGLVALAILVAHLAPDLLRVPTGDRTAFTAVAAAMLLGVSAASLERSLGQFRYYDLELSTPRGHLVVQSGDAPLVQLIERLRLLPSTTRIIAVPQGAAIPFFAGLESGEPLFSYLPMELPGQAADAELARRWAAHPPDLVLKVLLDQSEFGVRGFGRDYGVEAARWLEAHYATLGAVGPDAVLLGRVRSTP